jgi:hypothetical protein
MGDLGAQIPDGVVGWDTSPIHLQNPDVGKDHELGPLRFIFRTVSQGPITERVQRNTLLP